MQVSPEGKERDIAPSYFDEVEYTVRLIKDEPELLPPTSPDTTLFRVLISAAVNVTKNPGSAYRQGTDAELSPYGAALKDPSSCWLLRSWNSQLC